MSPRALWGFCSGEGNEVELQRESSVCLAAAFDETVFAAGTQEERGANCFL